MKYSARLVTALAVIAFVVVTFVTAIVKVTATGVFFVPSLFATLAWTALMAIVASIRGGVLFFHTSVLAFVALLGIALTRITKATTKHSFFGATASYRTFDVTTLTTIQRQGRVVQHRHQATATTHGYRHDDGTKGIIRRWLSRLIPLTGARTFPRLA